MQRAANARPKRPYVMRARSRAVGARREAILRAARDRFLSSPYDEVSLASIAARAGVSLKTLVRQFGTKEALLTATTERFAAEEGLARAVPPGDVAGAVRVLAERYEALGRATRSLLALEDRLHPIHEVLQVARRTHLGWLERTFGEHLPRGSAARNRRIAALFGATEIYVWLSWRRHLGLTRAEAEAAMREVLDALLERWKGEGATR